MNALPLAAERLRGPALALSRARWRTLVGLAALVVVSLLLRDTAIHARYWIDEGLSVGIASHPLRDIPGVLRQDGSPPLYYLLLGVWQRVVGIGEARTHALSLALALATIPLGFFAARRLFGERAGWFVAVLAASNPFVNYYAQETRMYTLLVVLSMGMSATFALAFVRGDRRWIAGFVLSSTALIYTHSWGLFAVMGSAAAAGVLLRERRVAVRDAAIAYGAIGVLYLPWVPTLVFQARHTGAPWSLRPSLGGLPGDAATLVGGPGPAVALLLVGGTGLAAYLAARRAAGAAVASDEAVVRAESARALVTMVAVAVAVAFVASQLSPAWTTRYFAAVIGPLLLVAGAALARAGTLGLVALALLAALWLHPPTARVNNKSDVHRVAHAIGDSPAHVVPGDIVVSTHPEQVPVLHFYFPRGLRWADGMGWVRDPAIMDWRDALDRYRRARPTPIADRLIRALRPGQQLVLVQPIIRTARWKAPWTELVRRRAARWERVLGRDRRLLRTGALPHFRPGPLPKGVRVVLYRRVG